jgi:membrane fusion protein, multidrug efflux system
VKKRGNSSGDLFRGQPGKAGSMKKLFRSLFYLAAFIFGALCAGVTNGHSSDFMEGMIEPFLEVKISSQVPGILDELLVERGDLVKKGQVVAKLRSGVERANVELARAQVEFSKRKLERNKELFAQEHISAHEKDEIETEIKKGEAQLQEATERLEMRMIRSTVDGVVVKRDLAAGEYVGDKGPIMTVAQINPLNVEVVVPVRRYGSISRGMAAEVRPEAPVGGVYTGTVVIVDRVIDAASGTFGVRVQLPNPNLTLPAGLKCKVRFYKK